jgi:hypothetical protein
MVKTWQGRESKVQLLTAKEHVSSWKYPSRHAQAEGRVWALQQRLLMSASALVAEENQRQGQRQ